MLCAKMLIIILLFHEVLLIFFGLLINILFTSFNQLAQSNPPLILT